MPELPEVETVVRGLNHGLKPGATLSDIQLNRSDLRRPFNKYALMQVQGEKLQRIHRRAKYILMEFEHHTLISHLGMSGSWRFAKAGGEKPHDHVKLYFGKSQELIYNDPRRFGLLDVVKKGKEAQWPGIKNLGVEPLSKEFNLKYLWPKTRRRKQAIKTFLMDQKVVVGVGNIYASEALFLAGVRPARPTGRVTQREMDSIIMTIKATLQAAIDSGGSTIRDFVGTEGHGGVFQERLFVYGRSQKPCRRCHSPIVSRTLGGRSTFWCSRCQR